MVGDSGVLTQSSANQGDRLGWGLAAGAAMLLALQVEHDPVARLWAQAFAGPFFAGDPALAGLAVLLFAGLVCARMASLSPGQRPGRWPLAGLATALLLGHGASLGAQLWSWQAFDLPWHASAQTLLQAWTGAAGGSAAAESSSAMGALAGLGAACLVFGVVASISLWPAVLRRWGLAGSLLFGYCSLSCLIAIAGQGPLGYRFLPVAAVLALMLASLAGVDPGAQRRLAGHALPWLWVLTLLSCQAAADSTGAVMLGMAATLGLLAGLGLVAVPLRSASGQVLRPALVFVCASMGVVALTASLLATPVALLSPLDEGMLAVVCSDGPCRQQAVVGRSAYEVYRSAGDDPLDPRHTFIAPAGQLGAAGPQVFAVRALPIRAAEAGPAVPLQVLSMSPRAGSVEWQVELAGTGLPQLFGGSLHPFAGRNLEVCRRLASAALLGQGLQLHSLALADGRPRPRPTTRSF